MKVTLLLCASLILLPSMAGATVIDRIAATIDHDVITTSAIDQIIRLRLYQRNNGEDDSAFRARVLDALIAQALRYRDAVRFGAEDLSADQVQARFREVVARFSSPEEFQKVLTETELSADEVKALIKRQLQVDAYVEERFSPLIFVALEEIETYYRDVWVPQRRERSLPIQPLGEVRESIRDLLKSDRLQKELEIWTNQLRSQVNVDIYL
ncbi:MAG: hypothetical protein ABI718_03580 [Acidobacteriota bacterium]